MPRLYYKKVGVNGVSFICTLRYVKEKLAEAEVAAERDEWMDAAELFKEWDSWDAVKI
jgi:hypothetical protein